MTASSDRAVAVSARPQSPHVCVIFLVGRKQKLTDTSVYAYAAHIATTTGGNIHVVDPMINVFDSREDMFESHYNKQILKYLVMDDYVIAFPVCHSVHWWVVFATYNSLDRTVMLSACNSHSGYAKDVENSLHKIESVINLLNRNPIFLQENNSSSYDFGITCEVMKTPQQRESRGCGAHTCAHIHLAARNMLHTHTIDEHFNANLRVKAVNYFNTFKQC